MPKKIQPYKISMLSHQTSTNKITEPSNRTHVNQHRTTYTTP